jgi:8-amino-7-oxononanoate synthase
MDDALYFSTGYMANIGVMPALVGRGDAIFADKVNHASLVDGALLSRAELIRYPHCDLAALEARLAASTPRAS